MASAQAQPNMFSACLSACLSVCLVPVCQGGSHSARPSSVALRKAPTRSSPSAESAPSFSLALYSRYSLRSEYIPFLSTCAGGYHALRLARYKPPRREHVSRCRDPGTQARCTVGVRSYSLTTHLRVRNSSGLPFSSFSGEGTWRGYETRDVGARRGEGETIARRGRDQGVRQAACGVRWACAGVTVGSGRVGSGRVQGVRRACAGRVQGRVGSVRSRSHLVGPSPSPNPSRAAYEVGAALRAAPVLLGVEGVWVGLG